MKKLRSYLLSAVVMLLFVCTFMGVKAEAATAPAQVTGLKQKAASYDEIRLEWNALLDNGVKYEVSISTGNRNWIVKDTTSDNECRIDGLNTGSTYYVRVRAYIPEWDENN